MGGGKAQRSPKACADHAGSLQFHSRGLASQQGMLLLKAVGRAAHLRRGHRGTQHSALAAPGLAPRQRVRGVVPVHGVHPALAEGGRGLTLCSGRAQNN